MTSSAEEERMYDHAERLASLEAQQAHMLVQIARTEQDVSNLAASLSSTNTAVTGLVAKIEKWEGKFGAFLFIVGCIWTFIASIWNSVIEFFKFKLGV